jgi:hypothetical protein
LLLFVVLLQELGFVTLFIVGFAIFSVVLFVVAVVVILFGGIGEPPHLFPAAYFPYAAFDSCKLHVGCGVT